MTMTPEFILQIIIAVGSGLAVYAGIRADLARLHERATNAQSSADKAHERIDHLLTNN